MESVTVMKLLLVVLGHTVCFCIDVTCLHDNVEGGCCALFKKGAFSTSMWFVKAGENTASTDQKNSSKSI